MDRRTAKRLYERLVSSIGEILSRHDPIRLLSEGAPDDEYEPEVAHIVARLSGTTRPYDVAELVHGTFVEQYDRSTAGPPGRYLAPAHEIWAAWVAYRAACLTRETDVEVVPPERGPVLYLGERVNPLLIVRVGSRFWVSTTDEPSSWWLGEGHEGVIRLWGRYGTLEEAFSQH